MEYVLAPITAQLRHIASRVVINSEPEPTTSQRMMAATRGRKPNTPIRVRQRERGIYTGYARARLLRQRHRRVYIERLVVMRGDGIRARRYAAYAGKRR